MGMEEDFRVMEASDLDYQEIHNPEALPFV